MTKDKRNYNDYSQKKVSHRYYQKESRNFPSGLGRGRWHWVTPPEDLPS